MIKKIQLFAERNTGSKWLTQILESTYGISEPWELGWKHWFPDYNIIDETDTSEYLFILLTRNAYDWVTCMNEKPHHVHPNLKGLEIEDFMNMEWECQWNKEEVPWLSDEQNLTEMMHERHPETGERFKNIFKLRNQKNYEMLKLENKVKNFMVIRYEDLVSNPTGVIKEINTRFPMNVVKNTRPRVKKEKIEKLPKEIKNMINLELDWDIERKLGYRKNSSK